MILAFAAIVAGLLALIWSATRFVDSAAAIANRLGMSPLLIGMLIVGFGTSMPEMVVSGLASHQGNPGIALGNAYGSNITNIAMILGLTALMRPILVHSTVLRRELPVLVAVTALAAWQLMDGELTRGDGVSLLVVFAALMGWSLWQDRKSEADTLGDDVAQSLDSVQVSMPRATALLVLALIALIASSRLLVWGAVETAQGFGVSDLIIGLTVIAVGTSMPELASSVVAARRGQNDIALGNILGSNLFNTLAVVGIAGSIHPLKVAADVLQRDVLVMAVLTLSLFIIGYGFRGQGQISRIEGGALLACYLGYTAFLIRTTF